MRLLCNGSTRSSLIENLSADSSGRSYTTIPILPRTIRQLPENKESGFVPFNASCVRYNNSLNCRCQELFEKFFRDLHWRINTNVEKISYRHQCVQLFIKCLLSAINRQQAFLCFQAFEIFLYLCWLKIHSRAVFSWYDSSQPRLWCAICGRSTPSSGNAVAASKIT